jgi:predicted F0F1-ATPase subunit
MQDDVDKLGKIISEKERRKVNALTEKKISEWSGLGMFGMVGWSVTVSTLMVGQTLSANLFMDNNMFDIGFGKWLLHLMEMDYETRLRYG